MSSRVVCLLSAECQSVTELLSKSEWKRVCCEAGYSDTIIQDWTSLPGCGKSWSCDMVDSMQECPQAQETLQCECYAVDHRWKHTELQQGQVHIWTTNWCMLQFCDIFVEETVEHLLFLCPALDITRDRLWENFMSAAPVGLLESIAMMSQREKLSGFRSQYVKEWQTLYEAVAVFISTLYDIRCKRMWEHVE